MKILVTGSTGLVGSKLIERLTEEGHEPYRLVRSAPQKDNEIHWDIHEGKLDVADLAGIEAVVHLAGENIASLGWSEDKKEKILKSRVEGTSLLARTLADMEDPPSVLINASAVGYYGDRGEEKVDEASEPGDFFLSEVCVKWEEATEPAAEKGIRVVKMRLGIVLSPEGGALAQMLTPFKLCLGGRLGSGEQYMSWITLPDVVGAILFCIENDSLSGPVNFGAPEPVTNLEFTKTLGRVLSRPTIFPVPAFVIKILFGQMGREMLLASVRMVPQKLKDSDYTFCHPTLEKALKDLLEKK